jgi:hypothetical protein
MDYLFEGMKACWKNKRMVVLFYLVNVLFGLIVMIPFRTILVNFAGHSLVGKSLAEHFDLEFIIEFVRKNDGVFSTLMSLFLVAGAMYWLVGLFLSGGAYGMFVAGEKYSAQLFWKNAGEYFGRFIRLFLWSIPVFVVFYSIQFLENGFIRIFFGKDPYQNIIYWGSMVKTGLGYFGILLYYVVLDYARIYTVRTGERKMRIALWHGISFTFRHFFLTFALSLVMFLIGTIALLVYNPIADALHAPNALVVILLLVVQQCYILFRMLLRLILYAGQTSLHKHKAGEELFIIPTAPSDPGTLEPVVGF